MSPATVLYISYFELLQEFRGKGYGAEMLKVLLDVGKSSIVVTEWFSMNQKGKTSEKFAKFVAQFGFRRVDVPADVLGEADNEYYVLEPFAENSDSSSSSGSRKRRRGAETAGNDESGKKARAEPLVAGVFTKKMYRVLLSAAGYGMDMVADTVEWMKFKNHEPRDISDHDIHLADFIPESHRCRMFKSFAMGWSQLFRAIYRILEQEKVPTHDAIHEFCMTNLDSRYHMHFMDKGGQISWAIHAILFYASDDIDAVRMILEEDYGKDYGSALFAPVDDIEGFFAECNFADAHNAMLEPSSGRPCVADFLRNPALRAMYGLN